MTRTNMKEYPSKSVWTSFNRQRISLTVFFHWWIKLSWLENLTLVKLSMFVCHSFLGFLVARIIFASVIAKFFINMAFATIYVFSTELFPTVVRYCCIGFFLSVRLRGHNRAVDLQFDRLQVEKKNSSPIRCAHLWNIFQYEKRNFVSPSSHVIFWLVI